MSDEIKDRAFEQALKHFRKFQSENKWEYILEKYAYVSNAYFYYGSILSDCYERKAKMSDGEYSNYCYYNSYREMLATYIANNTLLFNDYKEDKNGNWILKSPPPVAPIEAEPHRKKRGFFK